ncbi:MAG: hypothetical protein IT259_17510 [Saprospiraceae bacterium]|nr:hypothetical protein [Saprospiraceae bacterium]
MKTILKWLVGLSAAFLLGALLVPVFCSDRIGPCLESWALALVVGATLCALATAGLAGFQMWLTEETQRRKDEQEYAIRRDRENAAQYDTVQKLKSQLATAEKKPAPELPAKEQRLFQLAEKLRTKTTETDGVVTVDEVPTAIRDFIVESFNK